MQAIFKREFRAYFKSPIGYIFLGAFIFYASLMFVMINLNAQSTALTGFFSNISLIFVFIIPIITMRLFSEERKSKTDQLLLTAPVKVSGIVLGKFFAAAAVLLISVVATMFFILIMKMYGSPAVGEAVVGYFGLFLIGLLFISIGMFMSSLTESQVVSAVSTLAILFFLWFLANLNMNFSSILQGGWAWLGKVLDWLLDFLSINKRYYDFSIGTLNFVPIFYFVSLTALFNLLTIRMVEKRRWR